MRKQRSGRFGAMPQTVLTACVSGAFAVCALAGTAGGASPHKAQLISQAKKSLLVKSDLPKGWTSTKSSNNNSQFPGAAQLASCLGVPASVINSNPPTAYSPNFASKNQLQQASDSVSIYSSAAAAQTDYASLANAKTPSCLTTVLNGPAKSAFDAGFGSGTTVGTVQVTRSPATEFAPHSANFTAFFPVTEQGTTINVQLVLVDYVSGKVEQTVTLIALGSPFPTSLAKHLTSVAAGRI